MIQTTKKVIFTMAICGSVILAQVAVKEKPIKNTSAASGEEMYASYCAACHGAGGKGDGPAEPALKQHPTDLTSLAANNNGQFPTMKVQNILRQGKIAAHGSSEMPVWGPLFKSIGGSSQSEGTTNLRINNLANYIKSLQK